MDLESFFERLEYDRFIEIARDHRIVGFDTAFAGFFDHSFDLEKSRCFFSASRKSVAFVIFFFGGPDARDDRTAAAGKAEALVHSAR